MHTCCRLHSVTRRTLRFSAAYLLGLFLVMISCDILATSTGRLRPYFAQECPSAYQSCIGSPTTSVDAKETPTNPPIKSTPLSPGALVAEEKLPEVAGRILQEPRLQSVFERRWVDLNMQKLDVVCQFNGGDPDVEFQFRHLGTSWPSFPATVFTYACLYVACYLCFAGTARPVRIITSSLVVALALIAVIFNVQLVKERYHHWDDVIAGAVLAFAMVTFILYVYLNKFRDYHYYGNQKFRRLSPKHSLDANLANYNTAETTLGHYNMSDVAIGATNSAMQNDETTGSVSNNDLAMRYFQIPRANYRGTNRPMSAVGQVRP